MAELHGHDVRSQLSPEEQLVEARRERERAEIEVFVCVCSNPHQNAF